MQNDLVIHKFPFAIDDVVPIEIDNDADILKIEMQNGTPCLWALVDPESEKSPMKLFIVGTGHQHPRAWWSDKIYMDTFQDGQFVWHVFSKDLSVLD